MPFGHTYSIPYLILCASNIDHLTLVQKYMTKPLGCLPLANAAINKNSTSYTYNIKIESKIYY